MTFRQARGFYLRLHVAGEISAKEYWRRVRAIAAAERAAARDQEALREKRREAVRKCRATAKLRRQLQQSLQECA